MKKQLNLSGAQILTKNDMKNVAGGLHDWMVTCDNGAMHITYSFEDAKRWLNENCNNKGDMETMP